MKKHNLQIMPYTTKTNKKEKKLWEEYIAKTYGTNLNINNVQLYN